MKSCEFRVRLDGGAMQCALVRLLTDRPQATASVDAQTCAACGRTRAPSAARPNAVVASLVYEEVRHYAANVTEPKALVYAFERLAWAAHYLDDIARTSGRNLGFGRTIREPLENARRWVQTRVSRHRHGRPRIGLVGPDNLKGLGHLNRDLMKWLPIDDWICPEPVVRKAGSGITSRMAELLRNVDVLLFVETPFHDQLPKRARQQGVRVVCVPMWEALQPGLPWLWDVDLMVCPTKRAFSMLSEWRQRFGFTWELRCCAWPIDVEAIPFRLRKSCRQFVFINGTDHVRPRSQIGALTPTRRKGLEWILEAALRMPQVPFVVWSRTDEVLKLPRNVSWRSSVKTNAELYSEGDVCLQLSRWEGLGLPLLECQAAGMPLITVDEAPMNEHNPLDTVPVVDFEPLELQPRRWIAAPRLAVDNLVETLTRWRDKDISQASWQAREFVRREHSWQHARESLLGWIVGDSAGVEEEK